MTDFVASRVIHELDSIGSDYVRMLDADMTGPKSGRLYGARRKVKQQLRRMAKGNNKGVSGVHRASAPGEAPAVWTAAYRKGIRYRIERLGADWVLSVGVTKQSGRGGPTGKTGKSVAEDLELGTSRIRPRPMWRPALAKLIQKWKMRA